MLLFVLLEERLARGLADGLARGPWFVVVLKFAVVVVMPVVFEEDTEY